MRRAAVVSPFEGPGPRIVGWLRLLCLLLIPPAWLWPSPGVAAAGVALTPQTGIAVEGQFGGRAASVAAQGATVFLAVGPRIEVYDTADPAHPRLLGQTPLLPEDVQQIAVSGTELLAAYQSLVDPNAQAGFVTFDVSTPGVPREGGRFALADHFVAMAASGTIAYVAT